MEIKIGDKNYKLREIKYTEVLELQSLNDKKALSRGLICLSTGLTEQQFNELTLKEGLELQKKVNELNGLGDFQ